MNRKGRHKERHRKKEEPDKTAEPQQPDMEQELVDVAEEGEVDEPVEEENIYISDQEDETREFYILKHFLSILSR